MIEQTRPHHHYLQKTGTTMLEMKEKHLMMVVMMMRKVGVVYCFHGYFTYYLTRNVRSSGCSFSVYFL